MPTLLMIRSYANILSRNATIKEISAIKSTLAVFAYLHFPHTLTVNWIIFPLIDLMRNGPTKNR